jgi:1,4-dihydroxy-2-naphthoate octaprenyltransferase
MATVRFGSRTYKLPKSPILRMVLGAIFVLGGFLGFLPILGFWMVPVGLVILSVDIPAVRRFRRNMNVRLGNWLKRRYPRLASLLGFGGSNGSGRPRG